jgi:hypothetical protein
VVVDGAAIIQIFAGMPNDFKRHRTNATAAWRRYLLPSTQVIQQQVKEGS